MSTFAEAVAASGGRMEATPRAPAPPEPPPVPAPAPFIGMDSPVVDPRSGEILPDLRAETTTRLADVAVELRIRAERFTVWRKAIEAELVLRLEAEGRRMAVVGDYELSMESGRRRVWDPDDLRDAAQRLVEGGVVTAGELAGLIRTERKVDGNMARDLLNRLQGEPRAEVEACFRWQTNPPRLRIVESVNLADALPEGLGE